MVLIKDMMLIWQTFAIYLHWHGNRCNKRQLQDAGNVLAVYHALYRLILPNYLGLHTIESQRTKI